MAIRAPDGANNDMIEQHGWNALKVEASNNSGVGAIVHQEIDSNLSPDQKST